jgi:radical SAM family uncharacterized protein
MDKKYETLLSRVQRPGRYIGREINSVVKDWGSASLKIALVFPDVYEIGMSHLGIKILYHLLNAQDNVLCERVFAPWIDMETLLRENNSPIVSLENNKPLKEFDIVGFSLSHELNYTNVLNILDSSGIPLRAKQRESPSPLIIAGGPCAFNPEPMSEFIDLFLIGDGEEGILEIADRFLRCVKNSELKKDKKALLKEFIDLEGVYIPGFYKATYKEGSFDKLVPVEKGVPAAIKKRSIPDIETSFYPTKQLVSYIPITHDRISLEIMRGCPHRCRFCQATIIYSPIRLRSKDTVIGLLRETQKLTGYDEISLMSLSTGDYPKIEDMLQALVDEYKPKGVSISLPSLRVGKGIKNLPPIIRKLKKTGFTFAPEVGSEKLRRLINKNVDINRLLEGAKNAYELGWRKIKLYFMIGLPGESKEDLDGIIDMAVKIANLRANRRSGRANITLSISSFIPKPHTPFQWEAMAPAELLRDKILYLKKNIRTGKIKINVHDIEMSRLEGVLSRGDRKLADVIESAYLQGARFDNWSDSFKIDLWNRAFMECKINPDAYLKSRAYSEPLSWEHINPGIDKAALYNDRIKVQYVDN